MGYPVAEIQTAFIARYRANTTLHGLLAGAAAPEWGVFDADGVPVGYTGDYIVTFPITNQIGEDMSFDADATDTYQQVSIFTKSKGFAKARAIAKEIKNTTHKQAFDLSAAGFNQYLILFDSDQELSEDGINQHIPQRYELKTQG